MKGKDVAMTNEEARDRIRSRFPEGDKTSDLYKAIIVALERSRDLLKITIEIRNIWMEEL